MNHTAKKMWQFLSRGMRKGATGEKGVAAVEFAMTIPIWVTLLLGIVDGSYFLLVNERVDRIAYTVTDIVTQYTAITKANLNDIMMAAGQLMQPIAFNSTSMGMQIGSTGTYVPATGYIIVTSVFQPSTGGPIVEWQYSYPPTGHGVTMPASTVGNSTQGSAAVLPNGLTLNAQDNVIVSEVYYTFSPLFLDQFLSKVVYRNAVYKPRLSPLTTPPT